MAKMKRYEVSFFDVEGRHEIVYVWAETPAKAKRKVVEEDPSRKITRAKKYDDYYIRAWHNQAEQ